MQHESSEKTEQRHRASRVLHAVDRWAARPTLALGAVVAVVVWVLVSAVFGFPARLETVSWTLAAATMLIMVFVIQYTHRLVPRRPPSASSTRSSAPSPEADNTLITLEEAPDNVLKAATDAHRDADRDARSEGPS